MRKLALTALVLGLFAPSAQAGDPAQGATTFFRYEAWMSPQQEGGEESETPKALQKSLGSTAPSIEREQRKSRGYGELRFTRDLSRAYVEVRIEGVKPEDVVMFHIHCGPPNVLGPIVVDLGTFGSFQKTLVDGRFSAEIRNKDIVFIKDMHGLKPALPEGCPIDFGVPTQAKTVGGLEYLARRGVLYFNLHTKAHTYYGEMRGQIYPAKE